LSSQNYTPEQQESIKSPIESKPIIQQEGKKNFSFVKKNIEIPEYVPIGATSINQMFSSEKYLAQMKGDPNKKQEIEPKNEEINEKIESKNENSKNKHESKENSKSNSPNENKEKIISKPKTKDNSIIPEIKNNENNYEGRQNLAIKMPTDQKTENSVCQNEAVKIIEQLPEIKPDSINIPTLAQHEIKENTSQIGQVYENEASIKPEPEKYNAPLVHTYSFPNALTAQKKQKILSEAEQIYSQKYTKENIASVIHPKISGIPNIQAMQATGFKGRKMTPSFVRRFRTGTSNSRSTVLNNNFNMNPRRSRSRIEYGKTTNNQNSEYLVTGQRAITASVRNSQEFISKNQYNVMQNKIIKERSSPEIQELGNKLKEYGSVEANNMIISELLQKGTKVQPQADFNDKNPKNGLLGLNNISNKSIKNERIFLK